MGAMISGERWRLGHRPGLDGLRGVAILLVVISHLGIGRLERLGGVGVTVFFTLSGFLITSLLLEERDRAGRISISGFYRRRVIRLAPAFLLMLAMVVPLEYSLYGAAPYWWTTVLEFGNWISATRGPGALIMLHHTWSLAIEEQYYLVWPVMLGLTTRWCGRRGLIGLIGAGIVLSLIAGRLVNGYRLSFGTDTNAVSLLAGCLLAALMVGRSVRTPPLITAPLGLALIASGHLVPLGTALAIWTLSTRAAGILGWAPLRAAGRVSYGWYLWNYPITLLAIRGGIPLYVVPAASLAVALLSWSLVEKPITSLERRRHDRRNAVSPFALIELPNPDPQPSSRP
jgi:peptidoglycan/LPS O-acetylase OafA/YrhL